MFRWKPDISPAQVAAIGAALDTLPPAIASIRSYRHGPSVGLSDGAFDYGIVATFDDADGWRRYDTDAVHEAVRADTIRPWIAERASTQFET
ncbi:MAG: Dabb family protein [Actinobacteria bacterium]|nr:Dabb family protein [Actinomycetota bacterium]